MWMPERAYYYRKTANEFSVCAHIQNTSVHMLIAKQKKILRKTIAFTKIKRETTTNHRTKRQTHHSTHATRRSSSSWSWEQFSPYTFALTEIMHGAFVQSQQKTRNANDAITGNELYIMWCAAQVKTAETHFDFVCMFNVYKYEKKKEMRRLASTIPWMVKFSLMVCILLFLFIPFHYICKRFATEKKTFLFFSSDSKA